MIYHLDSNNRTRLKKVKQTSLAAIGWSEKDLENLVVANMDKVIAYDSLMVIFQERKLQEEPDIMALDRKGDLYIFELKRWASNQENLLQVLRYGQLYGDSRYDQLNRFYQKYKKNNQVSLINDHKQYFALSDDDQLQKHAFNLQQHFLIITDGTDFETRSSVYYWRSKGLSIEAIPFRVFKTNQGEPMIEFQLYSPESINMETPDGGFIFNTNFTNDPRDHDDMLSNCKVAAYYRPWKNKIKKIKKGDKVFLYQSGVGIVAMGKGSGDLVKANRYGSDAEEHIEQEYSMKLKEFIKLSHPMHAGEIKKALQLSKNYPFVSTMIPIGEEKGELLWEYITRNKI
jgi:hypothetical protein